MSIFTHRDTCSYRDKQVFTLFRYRCSLTLSSNIAFKVSLVWYLIIIHWQNYSKHWLGYLLLSWVDTTHWWHNPSLFNKRLFLILPAREFKCFTKENNFSDWHCSLVLCWPSIWVWNLRISYRFQTASFFNIASYDYEMQYWITPASLCMCETNETAFGDITCTQ